MAARRSRPFGLTPAAGNVSERRVRRGGALLKAGLETFDSHEVAGGTGLVE